MGLLFIRQSQVEIPKMGYLFQRRELGNWMHLIIRRWNLGDNHISSIKYGLMLLCLVCNASLAIYSFYDFLDVL